MKMHEFRLKFHLCYVPKRPINNIQTLVQIMVWRWLGAKPLSETMMVRLPAHLCVTRSQWVNASVTSNHRPPYDFYHPHDFLPVRPSEAPVRILRRCCSRGQIRLRAPTVWHGCTLMVSSNNSQDSTWIPHAIPVRASYSPVREYLMFFNSYGTLTEPVRDPQGCRTAPLWTRKGIDTIRICKNPVRASYLTVRGPHGSLRSPHGLFRGCLRAPDPYGARKLIIHVLKLYGPRTGRKNSYGAARGPYDICSKLPGNSPRTARTGPGSVMWPRHNWHGSAKSNPGVVRPTFNKDQGMIMSLHNYIILACNYPSMQLFQMQLS